MRAKLLTITRCENQRAEPRGERRAEAAHVFAEVTRGQASAWARSSLSALHGLLMHYYFVHNNIFLFFPRLPTRLGRHPSVSPPARPCPRQPRLSTASFSAVEHFLPFVTITFHPPVTCGGLPTDAHRRLDSSASRILKDWGGRADPDLENLLSRPDKWTLSWSFLGVRASTEGQLAAIGNMLVNSRRANGLRR